MLFSGAANADLVNDWTRNMLCKELRPGSTIIWDNAPFHKKNDLASIAKEYGHHILFLPPYTELAPENWTDLGIELRCDIAPRMVKNQGDRDGEHTEETYSSI